MARLAQRQLHAGAAGLTCAKLSEAEALLGAFGSGAIKNRPASCSLFLAHSLVDARQAPRLRNLAGMLDELIVACTSEAHVPHLEKVLAAADLELPVMLALDTGLGREGARDTAGAVRLAHAIAAQTHMKLHGIYTHEGHLYGDSPQPLAERIEGVHDQLVATRDAIQSELRVELKLWPGSSVGALHMATLPGVDAVRPGAYVFGDLALCETTRTMRTTDIALTVLAMVVDKPQSGLAIIDAGSKVFSSDKTRAGIFARHYAGRDLIVSKLSEEHGHVSGRDVDSLQIGERVRFVPAHVCTTINLAHEVNVLCDDVVVEQWPIEARGCVR